MLINSCLDNTYMIDEYPIYMTIDDQQVLIARYKALSRSDVNEVSYTVYNDGSITSINPMAYNIALITKSLVWWVFDAPIDAHNIDMLSGKYKDVIVGSIMNFINGYSMSESPYYENIKLYINLIENKENRKHIKALLNNDTVIDVVCSKCRQYETCNRPMMPKILPISKRATEYAYRTISSSGNDYLYGDRWEDVPEYLISFVNYATTHIMTVRSSKQEKDD